MKVHICSFEACPEFKGKVPYEEFKAAVLKAGRFSEFEASRTRNTARLFAKLCKDPTVETDISCGYPWTIVRERSA